MKARVSPTARKLIDELGHEITRIVISGGGVVQTSDGKKYRISKIPKKMTQPKSFVQRLGEVFNV